MEHAIRHEIHVKFDENPAYYQGLRDRLEQIIADRKTQRIDAAEQLSLSLQMRADMDAGPAASAADLALTESGFAIYGVLERARPTAAEDADEDGESPNRDLASLIDDAIEPFTQLVDWHTKDDVQRKIRKAVKRHLRAAGISNVDAIAGALVDLAKARRPS